ncbi:MAG: DUF4938 domain-containing protein [Chloroflexaceae bacterium]
MLPPIAVRRLRAYEGPHIFGPWTGVRLQVCCDSDRSLRLRAAIKDGAQFIGLVIAYLEVTARADEPGYLVTASFTTDAPRLGADLCAYVVEGIDAEARGDATWDRDGPLFALQARRRAEALPAAALQLVAEARRRNLPCFTRADGQVQVGYGARGWHFDPEPLRAPGASAPPPPWERLGRIPIIAVTGGALRGAAVERMAAELAGYGAQPAVIDGASFAATRELLADPRVEALVVGLDTGDVLRRGVAFDACDLAVISDRGDEMPPDADDPEELLRALGVPMLLSAQPARINLSDPRLLPLVPYAPYGVIGN